MRIFQTVLLGSSILIWLGGCGPGESNAAAPHARPPAAATASRTVHGEASSGDTASKATEQIVAEADAAPEPRTITLDERAFLNDRLTLLIPDSFEPMDEERVRLAYPAGRRPQVVFNDTIDDVTIAIAHTPTRVTHTQLPRHYRLNLAQIKEAHPGAKWFQNDLGPINGRKYFLFDYRWSEGGAKTRHVMLGTSFQGRLLTITYTMPSEQEAAWLPLANSIIESVTIRD